MIVAVTANPSLDRTLEIDALLPGAVLRATTARVEPGGKGINVARALLAHGRAATAVVPVGGHSGEHLLALLRDRQLDVVAVPIGQPVRDNVALVEPDGTVTKVNAPGPQVSAAEVEAVAKATVSALADADWLAACGSLPPGAPDDLYARLVVEAHAIGTRVAVDTSGAPLGLAVSVGPDLVKPNGDELAEVAARPLATLGDVVAAAEQLRERGVGAVAVSLGADGAVLVSGDGTWHADTPPVTPVSNVGAGDALLAGFLAAGGVGPDALRTGVAWGAAAVQLPGSAMPGPDDVDLTAVRVGSPEFDRPLSQVVERR